MPTLRVSLGQFDPIVGDFAANSRRMISMVREAASVGADLVAFSEMAIDGYPIEDLATRPTFLRESRAAVEQLADDLESEGLGDIPVVVGFADGPFSPHASPLFNAPVAIAKNRAAVMQHGRIAGFYTKFHLPNYGVFDEFRNFISDDELLVIRVRGVDVALVICEDIWQDGGPVGRVADADAGLLLVINASPFERDKDDVRLPLVRQRARAADVHVAYVNMVGGQDDLVFDGDSVVVAPDGTILARAPQFVEQLLTVDLDLPGATFDSTPPGTTRIELDTPRDRLRPELLPSIATLPDDREQLWNALTLGLRDYVEKNGFPSVILGLSGGIDSSIVAAIACDAIGPDRTFGVSMPSRYSSEHSITDADQLVANLGMHYRTEPIRDLVIPFENQLHLESVAAENVQARARGVILMALSNQDGHLVLTTGNKSELAVGYSTIYGDAVGGFNPIKDVPKTLVWELARWRNEAAMARGEVAPIPENAITKAPSAELRPDQKDQDSLPEYSVLDPLLELYIAQKKGRDEIIAAGFDADLVDRIIALVDRAEWKRRQSAIGPKISGMAFGRDRRLPITYHPA